MKTVVYFYESAFTMWRRRLAGIFSVARKKGWHVEFVDVGVLSPDVRPVLEYWRPAGVIVEGGALTHANCRRGMFRGLPAVYCDADARRTGDAVFGVRQDSDDVVRKALRELFARKFGAYGFVHYRTKRDWTLERGRCFTETVRAHGKTGCVFAPWEMSGNHDGAAFFRELAGFLSSVPGPCGILAANDEMAVHVLRAARLAKIRVPEEMAVVGIDNDELVCENTVPTLSSIAPDFEASGRIAAELLSRRLADPGLEPRMVVFGSSPLVRRHSSLKTERVDIRAVRALEYVRANACDGLSAADVVRHMGLKARTAEKRFREVAGRSIRDEIIAVKISRAKKILEEGTVAVNSVYLYCGYRDERSLRYAFTKAEGISPAAWRKSRS